MSISRLAKLLGRRGGTQRAKSLSADRKKEIAAFGGRARSESLQMTKRIEENFRYLEAMNELSKSR